MKVIISLFFVTRKFLFLFHDIIFLLGRAEQPYEYLVDIWSLGLVILQVIMEMKSKDLIQLITSTCIDESCYDLLNPGIKHFFI